MSVTSYRRRPDYYLAEFATKKFQDGKLRGNILLMGEDNGRNAEFLVNTFLKRWGNPEYKVYVFDDFDDKFGRERRRTFDEITANNRDSITVLSSSDFDTLFERQYVLVVFIDFYTAPEVFQYAMSLWSAIVDGGYYFFLNYKDGDTMYYGNLNDHPREGIDRFIREARWSSQDYDMTPYPYLRKY
jgi:hypothetical protein